MILLTKLDKSPVIISMEAVKMVDRIPDTLVTFINGDSIIVRETLEEVIQKAIAQKAKILELAQIKSKDLL